MSDNDAEEYPNDTTHPEDVVRACRSCDQQVTTKYTAHGDPVLWDCSECGLRDEHETESVLRKDLPTTDDELSEEARKL